MSKKTELMPNYLNNHTVKWGEDNQIKIKVYTKDEEYFFDNLNDLKNYIDTRLKQAIDEAYTLGEQTGMDISTRSTREQIQKNYSDLEQLYKKYLTSEDKGDE